MINKIPGEKITISSHTYSRLYINDHDLNTYILNTISNKFRSNITKEKQKLEKKLNHTFTIY